MKETLAAAMLTWAGWPRIAREGGAFVDFMCGSGTLPIEAALIAGDIAPGLLRRKWGFLRWLGHDTEAWERLLDEANKREQAGREAIPPIVASDIDAKSIEIARRAIRRAELEKYIYLSVKDMTKVKRTEISRNREGTGLEASASGGGTGLEASASGGGTGLEASASGEGTSSEVGNDVGLIALNPPYGKRMLETDQLPKLYAQLKTALKPWKGYRLALITSDPAISKRLDLKPQHSYAVRNGPIDAEILTYHL
jgi:23S rRNA (guanine2445-N2)-methyltransferase / 23S rRNA (guanine2069-N7)-methyltransferase